MLNLFYISNIQGRELCWHDSVKYTVNVVPCLDASNPIYFKLGMMLDRTKLQFDSTLMFTEGHRDT